MILPKVFYLQLETCQAVYKSSLTGFATGSFGTVFAHLGGHEFSQSLIGTAAGGAVGGAFGALITDSNVLEGASRGLVIALVNDAMHSAFEQNKQPDPPVAKSLVLKVEVTSPHDGSVATHYITEAFGAVGSAATIGSYVLSDGNKYLAFNQVTGKFKYISKGALINNIYIDLLCILDKMEKCNFKFINVSSFKSNLLVPSYKKNKLRDLKEYIDLLLEMSLDQSMPQDEELAKLRSKYSKKNKRTIDRIIRDDKVINEGEYRLIIELLNDTNHILLQKK